MTQRTTNTRRGRGPDSPLITEELKRLREKPPRVGKTEPLDQVIRVVPDEIERQPPQEGLVRE